MLLSSKIAIHITVRGRGVFANKPILRREIIEVCPTIVVGDNPGAPTDEAPCNEWACHFGGKAVIALGAGSLYNHERWPNANWNLRKVQGHRYIELFALRDIKIGEEICINYFGAPGEKGDLGFIPLDESKRPSRKRSKR
jgi:hypothetical protein